MTTRRRGRGEGGLRQRADGRWEASVELGYAGGKRRRKWVQGATKGEAIEKLREEQRRKDNGLPPTNARLRVSEFLRWWAANTLPGTVTPGTEATYRRQLELYVIPALGHLRLKELGPAHVTEMMQSMASGSLSKDGRPLSAQTQSGARKVLGRALRRAEQEGLLLRNVAKLADGPRVSRPEGRSLSRDEARLLGTATSGHRLAPAFGLQLFGLRRGEVLGLRWSDVDLDGEPCVVRIRRQLQRQAGKGLVLTELKTNRSRRNVVVPPQLTEQLRRWRAAQAAERLAIGESWQGRDDLVFTTPIGTPIDPDNYRKRFSAATKAAGLGHWHTHELRHSAGSLLFDAGVPLKVISEQLGHASERITSDIYVHTEQRQLARVAEVMAEVLWGDAPAAESS